MVVVRKIGASSGPQSLDILACKVKIITAELNLEERDITLGSGASFTAAPNLNCRLQVVRNLVQPSQHEGATLYDRFKLKKADDGDYSVAMYSKLGNLVVARYGEDWFLDPDAELEASDFEGFEFVCRLEPKRDAQGHELKGTVVDWASIRPAGPGEEREASKRATKAELEADEDLDDLPF